MKAAICLFLIFASQVYTGSSLRYLDERWAGRTTDLIADLSINGEIVVQQCRVNHSEHPHYLCCTGGTPSNSILLREPVMISGSYCFPHIYMVGLFSRFNPFNQSFSFRLHAPPDAGFSDNLRVRFLLQEDVVDDLNTMFKELSDLVVASKTEMKRLTDLLLERADRYNQLSAKRSTGNKSITEIQAEIQVYQAKVTQVTAKIQDENMKLNTLKAECEIATKSLQEQASDLSVLINKAVNIDNTINNNLLSIKTLEDSATDNAKAIKDATDRKNTAKENLHKNLEELRVLLPTEGENLDKISELVEKRDLAGVNTLVDSFVNVL